MRFRIGLRTFLIVLTLIVSFFGWKSFQARNQTGSIAEIQAANGTVMFDYHEAAPRAWSTAGQPKGPAWLRRILGPAYFDRVTYVGLFNTPAETSWIAAVNRLGTVKTLLLSGEHVTDETLRQLDGSRALQELHLTGSQVTDEGLKQLQKFPRLTWLIANHTSIADDGVASLSQLPDLREVNLSDTSVSDSCIPSLLKLTKLEKLNVRRTSVTEAGVVQLRQALPDARISD